jgi:hypothetical protein
VHVTIIKFLSLLLKLFGHPIMTIVRGAAAAVCLGIIPSHMDSISTDDCTANPSTPSTYLISIAIGLSIGIILRLIFGFVFVRVEETLSSALPAIPA